MEKTYLTSDELIAIINDMKYIYEDGKIVGRKDAFNRHFTKVVSFAKACAKDKILECKSDDEVYDLCAREGLIEEFSKTYMYNEIENIIERDENVYNLMNETIEEVSKKVSELTSVNNMDKFKVMLNEGINKLKPLMEKANGNK